MHNLIECWLRHFRSRRQPSWRAACTFSLLSLTFARCLRQTSWLVAGPRGIIVESALRLMAWLYTFALCGLSLYLAGSAMKAYRRRGDRAGTGLSLAALIVGLIAIVVAYHAYGVVYR